MSEQSQKIRDLINTPIMQSPLLKNHALWNQLCSCLDVIEDSESAIDAYLDREFGESVGEHYLAVYGLLQALFIQQDAVINLCESLSTLETIDNYPRLEKIRGVRNDTIGHPTKRGTKNKPTYHFISRPTLTYDGFQHVSFDSNGKPDSEDVRISDLITDQKTCLSEILTSAISELEQKKKANKEKFRMEKLVSVFPTALGYCFEKIFGGTTTIEDTRAPSNVPLGAASLSVITKALQNFKEALAKRGVYYDSVSYVCKLLEYPSAELEAFFQNAQNGKELNINEKTAYIFAFFVEKQVGELVSMAKEIDEDYSS